MKKITLLLCALTGLLLIACSGSDTYRGNWKAMSQSGEKLELVFGEKNLEIKDSTGKTSNVGYAQTSVNISNSVETYGISLDDGRSYQINFPIANDESKGLILDNNGNVVYSIGRTNYISYEELYKLN